MVKQVAVSLLELVVAIGLVAFTLLTMVAVAINGARLGQRGEQITRATEMGRSLLERLQDDGFVYLPDGDNVHDGRVPDPTDSVTGFPPSPYPSQENMSLVVATRQLEPQLKSVTATIYYQDESHLTLQTYFRP